MNETLVTVVGNVATTPVFRELPSGSVARFRLAATARRRDPATGLWSDGHTNFFTVWAWRALGSNVSASLSVGEPVIVQGKLRVRNEERGGGQQWMSADIDALTVGHDLSRGTSAFRRAQRTDHSSGEQQPGAPGAGTGTSATTAPGDEPAWERDPVPEADPTPGEEPATGAPAPAETPG
ncbi:single-stranded DNA-binding protein [Streptomyces sp. TS71-3]|uniref:single-stranded DNA-binding protein n=1 Tax=Streptomyces sp. TS71-3 TaxID=2733862 RepID=UPI001B2CEF80|nr:single-stranded DNA-binding protein [Streptomyces sp. TS71-3]GHJ37551.1 single-stranded DNA-binding protein 1 [Streptomyces sp. TS71-3]